MGFSPFIILLKRDMPGFEPEPLGWKINIVTNELQKVRNISEYKIKIKIKLSIFFGIFLLILLLCI